jgi:hypothetical protein
MAHVQQIFIENPPQCRARHMVGCLCSTNARTGILLLRLKYTLSHTLFVHFILCGLLSKGEQYRSPDVTINVVKRACSEAYVPRQPYNCCTISPGFAEI